MKKVLKQILAILCVVSMTAGSISIGSWSVNASTDEPHEWAILSEGMPIELVTEGESGKRISYSNGALGFNAPEREFDELALCLCVDILDTDSLTALQNCTVELAQTTCDQAELQWELNKEELQLGSNEICLRFDEAKHCADDNGTYLNLENTINWFRMFGSNTATSIQLTALKLVDIVEAGLTFGETDTYLSLTDKISQMPNTIEASVKMEAEKDEWSLATVEQMDRKSESGVTTEEDTQGSGMIYGIVSDNGYGVSSGRTFTALDFQALGEERLAVAFWFYASEAGYMPTGEIELGSSGTTDVAEKHWNTDYIYVNAGWNYVKLPFTSANDTATNFDLNNLIRFRWYWDDNSQDARTFKVTEIKIVALDEPVWTMASIGMMNRTGAGVTTSADKPGEGLRYAEVTVNSANHHILYQKKFEKAFDLSKYTEDDLALSFWLFTEQATTIGESQIELTSAGQSDSAEKHWDASKINLNAGWNYVELPLSEADATHSNFTLNNVNYVRWYLKSTEPSWSFKITEVEIVCHESQPEWTLVSATEFTGAVAASSVAAGGPDKGWNVADVTITEGTKVFEKTLPTTPDFGDYTMNDLVLAFWYYNAGDAMKVPGGELELASHSANGHDDYEIHFKPYDYYQLETGWNYVELPLSAYDGIGSKGFNLNNLQYVRWYTWAAIESWSFKVSDVKILVKEEVASGWQLTDSGSITWSNAKKYTWGARTQLKVITGGAEQIGAINTLDVSKYKDKLVRYEDDLALAFWYYTENAGALAPENVWLELTSSGTCDNEEISWNLHNIDVEAGWNYVILPFAERDASDGGSTDVDNDGKYTFTVTDINYMRLLTHQAISSWWNFEVGNFEIIVQNSEETEVAVTKNVSAETLDASMIFSNVNNGADKEYALYVTENGYPALLIDGTEYALQKNVNTGEWIDIAVVNDGDDIIFYLDGEYSGRHAVVGSTEVSFENPHCIGANYEGGQMMKGTIADVRLWSDARSTEEIVGNRVAKKYHKEHGLTDTEGLMDSWFLYGDIQDVIETMPNAANSNNPAVFRGTRAGDWYDYDISKHDFLWQDKNENGTFDNGEGNYWSMIFVPDIQNLTTGNRKPTETWNAMADWIAANVSTENIKYVLGAGDTTWDDKELQYNYAMQGIDKFKELVPFSTLIGNHDYQWNLTYRDSSNYQTHFGKDYVENEKNAISNLDWGYFEDAREDGDASQNIQTTTENSYYRFDVNRTSWMVLQLEYHPRTTVLEWADNVLKQYPNDNVILATHGYLTGAGEYCTEGMTYLNAEEQGDGTNYNEKMDVIWEKLKDNANIKLILCGHSVNDTGSVVVKEEVNEVGRTVKAMMINAQDLDANETASRDTRYYTTRPLGMLGILRFSEDGQQVALDYYSPTEGKSFNPQDTVDSTERNTKALKATHGVEAYIVKYDSATATVLPAENTIPEGYVFAGWYTDANATKVLRGTSNGAAYAKFVDADMLDVRFQIEVDVDNGVYSAAEGTTDIRFVTTTNSLKYQSIGFNIQVGSGTARDVGSNKVYQILYALGTTNEKMEYTPYDNFDLSANYFKTYTIEDVPSTYYDSISFKVCPYWITQDGTRVNGEERTVTIIEIVNALNSGNE